MRRLISRTSENTCVSNAGSCHTAKIMVQEWISWPSWCLWSSLKSCSSVIYSLLSNNQKWNFTYKSQIFNREEISFEASGKRGVFVAWKWWAESFSCSETMHIHCNLCLWPSWGCFLALCISDADNFKLSAMTQRPRYSQSIKVCVYCYHDSDDGQEKRKKLEYDINDCKKKILGRNWPIIKFRLIYAFRDHKVNTSRPGQKYVWNQPCSRNAAEWKVFLCEEPWVWS